MTAARAGAAARQAPGGADPLACPSADTRGPRSNGRRDSGAAAPPQEMQFNTQRSLMEKLPSRTLEKACPQCLEVYHRGGSRLFSRLKEENPVFSSPSLGFTAVKRHHNRGNSYKGPHFIGAGFQVRRFSLLSLWREASQHPGRHVLEELRVLPLLLKTAKRRLASRQMVTKNNPDGVQVL
ncbi:PDCD10 and GCKIII kinases-associated protein 1 isoform X3 [Arvicanthis niloticus]|uniref:PDCD10 and GCKIII kinases-associated protein 1 isoform X3 n=1 Tax=Arvicanthis niloticus TaxID=61156 RepID=UPI00402B7BFC